MRTFVNLADLKTEGIVIELPIDAYYVMGVYAITQRTVGQNIEYYYSQPAEIRLKLDTEAPVTSPIEVEAATPTLTVIPSLLICFCLLEWK